MAQKKFITLEKLGTYTEEVKKLVDAKDQAILAQAHEHAESLSDNYDAAGAAATAETNAKNYTNTEIAKVNGEVAKVKAQADKGVADAKTADGKAVAAQNAVNSLKAYVGEIPEGATAKDVVGYVNEKTANIASDATVKALTAKVGEAEKNIDAIKADYLKAADKTALEEKITVAQQKADAAQAHSEGVAGNLTTAKQALEEADTAQKNRIAALEAKIEGVSGAMHFKGVKTELPKVVDGYKEGDVIIVGEKEYVFNGTEFKEFGDVSAEGKRITTLEGEMDAVQADVTQAKKDITANTSAIAKKVEKTAFDEKVVELEATDTELDTRLKAVEGKIGESGSIATEIETAKNAAIAAASADATTKANTAEKNAKTYTDGEVAKDRTRLDALEADTHTHANKDLLDTYDQTNANLKDAVAKKHSHANADVLNRIDASKVATWDKVTAKADVTALTAETNRATAAEAALRASINEFVEASELEIKNLFAV